MNDKFKLDEYEQQVADRIEQYVPTDQETRATVRRIAQQARGPAATPIDGRHRGICPRRELVLLVTEGVGQVAVKVNTC